MSTRNCDSDANNGFLCPAADPQAPSQGNGNEAVATSGILVVPDSHVSPILTKQRWVILAAFSSLAISCLSSWYSFSSISNIIEKLYGQKLTVINWLALVNSISCILLMLPFSYICDRHGLSILLITAGFLNGLGCCVKYIGFSVSEYGFWFLLAGNFYQY